MPPAKKLPTNVLFNVREVLTGRFMSMLWEPKRPPALHNASKSAGGGIGASGTGFVSLLISQTQSRFGQSLQLLAVASSLWIIRLRDGMATSVWEKPLPSDCQERCIPSFGCALSEISRITSPPSIQPM